MPIPDYETLMGPLLQIAKASKEEEVSLPHAIEQLADQFKLTEGERRELLPSGGAFKFSSRASWARTYLQKAGLLEATRRGYFKITQRGIDALGKKESSLPPPRLRKRLLHQYVSIRPE
jgi:restriction system protein